MMMIYVASTAHIDDLRRKHEDLRRKQMMIYVASIAHVDDLCRKHRMIYVASIAHVAHVTRTGLQPLNFGKRSRSR